MGAFFRNPRWLAVALAVAAVALYLPTLGFDFVYDSKVQVGVDDFIRQPRHVFDCLSLRVLGMDVLDFNRPLNLVSLMADAALWGKNPAGFRWTNLLLHAATAVLLFRWLRRVTGSTGAAFCAALIFAVHPLHTETVVEVGYREDLLAGFFLLAGLNAAAAFDPRREGRGRLWAIGALTVACLWAAAASKENGVAGPVALAGYWWLFRREPGEPRRPWGALIAASGVAVAGFYALRFALEPRDSVIFAERPQAIATGFDWLLTQSRIWTAEALRVVWPAGLCADYGPWNLAGIEPFWGLLAVAGLATAGLVASILDRRVALGCLIAAAALAPVSNLVPIYRPMADRYLYLPMTGLALVLAAGLAGAGRWRKPAWALAGLAAVALACVTVREAAFWRDGATLWAEVSRLNPYSINGWLGQGDAAKDAGRLGDALGFYQKANTISQGKAALPWAGLALAWDELREPEKAADALAHAAKLDSRFAKPETLTRALMFREDETRRFIRINHQRAQSR